MIASQILGLILPSTASSRTRLAMTSILLSTQAQLDALDADADDCAASRQESGLDEPIVGAILRLQEVERVTGVRGPQVPLHNASWQRRPQRRSR
jgi:hypothetical protein